MSTVFYYGLKHDYGACKVFLVCKLEISGEKVLNLLGLVKFNVFKLIYKGDREGELNGDLCGGLVLYNCLPKSVVELFLVILVQFVVILYNRFLE